MSKEKLWLVDGETQCWRCGEKYRAVAIVITEGWRHKQPLIFRYLEEMPEVVKDAVAARFPMYKFKYVKKQNRSYYANHCSKCGVITGDYHLHDKVGGLFNPFRPECAALVRKRKIDIPGGFEFTEFKGLESYCDFLFSNAKEVKDKNVSGEGALLSSEAKEHCPACSSFSVTLRKSWLCYDFPVKVCSDCEWTADANGRQINPGRFAIYDDEIEFFPSEEEFGTP
jgi:hypothetical protein